MENTDVTSGNALPNKVEINLYMFGALMLNGVRGHVDGADIVIVDESSVAQRGAKLENKLAQPDHLSNCIGDSSVFGLGTGAGDCILPLGGPRDQIITQENCVPGGGLANVRTISPVGIRVSNQVRLCRGPNQ